MYEREGLSTAQIGVRNDVIGQLQKTAPPSKPITASTLVEDFDMVLNRASEYVYRLQTVADRVVGPSPQAAESAGSSTGNVPSSLLASINMRRSHLLDIVERMERALCVLEQNV